MLRLGERPAPRTSPTKCSAGRRSALPLPAPSSESSPPHHEPSTAKHHPVHHQAARLDIVLELRRRNDDGGAAAVAAARSSTHTASFGPGGKPDEKSCSVPFDMPSPHPLSLPAPRAPPPIHLAPPPPPPPPPPPYTHTRTRVGKSGVPSRSTRNSSASMKAMKSWAAPQRRRQRSYSATWGPCVPALGFTAQRGRQAGGQWAAGRQQAQGTRGAEGELAKQKRRGGTPPTLVVVLAVHQALVHKVLDCVLQKTAEGHRRALSNQGAAGR